MPQTPPGAYYFAITNPRTEAVEITIDGKSTGISIPAGNFKIVEVLPPAELKAIRSELKMDGGKIKLESKEVDVEKDDANPGPVPRALPDGRTVQAYNMKVKP